MIRNKHYEQEICKKHNLPQEYVNPDKSQPNQLYSCKQCIFEYYLLIPIQQIKQSNQRIIKQFEDQLDSNSKIWNISIHSLISLREVFTKSIKIIENIIDVIRNQIHQTTNEFNNINVNQMEVIKQAHESYLQTQLNHKRNIIQQIEVLKQNSSIDKLIQGLNEINLQRFNDLIVSGSYDESIIFWGLNGNKWQLDQQIQCSSYVYSLSLNDSNTKLLSCEENKLIQVFEQQGKKWIISQKISVEIEGVRLCFISDDQFVFLPCESRQLYFYKLDLQTNKFEKQLEVEVSSGDMGDFSGFPIKFIKSKNLLIVKNCQFANILRRQEKFTFIQEQSIKFNTSDLYGDVSEDGNFMVTWDKSTKEFQVRNLNEVK